MLSWLLIAAALHGPAWANAGVVTMQDLGSSNAAHRAKADALDFRIKQDRPPVGQRPMMRGMLVQHEVGPSTAIGIGLDTARNGRIDAATGRTPKRSRKPSVTFVVKF